MSTVNPAFELAQLERSLGLIDRGQAVASGVQSGIDYKNATANTPTGLAKFGNALNVGSSVMQGISGLANAYTGYKALGLAEDQFEFEKNLARANYTNSAMAYNNQVQSAANMAGQLGRDTNASAAEQAAYVQGLIDNSKQHQVSTSLGA